MRGIDIYHGDGNPLKAVPLKAYNESANRNGGYLNETLTCDSSTGAFIDCKSSFLSDLSKGNSNFDKVKVNKAGDTK